MRVCTFNVYWLGNSNKVPRRREHVDALATVLRHLDADVFALQEVVSLLELSELLRGANRSSRQWEFRDALQRWVVSSDSASEQKVVLVWDAARVELLGWSRLRLEPGRDPVLARFRERATGGVVCLAAAHLKSGQPTFHDSSSATQRGGESRGLAEWLRGEREAEDASFRAPDDAEPVVVLGDLNALRSSSSPSDAVVVDSLAPLHSLDGWSWNDAIEDECGGGAVTAWQENLLIDHMLFSPAAANLLTTPPRIYAFDGRAQFAAQAALISDHRPVYAELELRPGSAIPAGEGKNDAEVKLLLPPSCWKKLDDALKLGGPKERSVWFFDSPRQHLLDHGVIVRLRVGGKAETTVKVRRAPLPAGLEADFGRLGGFKVELDCSRQERIPAASLAEEIGEPRWVEDLPSWLDEPEDARFFLSQRQLALLARTGMEIPWSELRPFGPIESEKWESDEHELSVERWTVDGGQVIEVSRRAAASDTALADLEALLDSWEIDADGLPGGKTRWALERLR